MEIKIEISDRARTYGYIIWAHRRDAEMRQLLGHADEMRIILHGNDLGKKRIDWDRRRISIGPKQTDKISPSQKYLVLTNRKKGELAVETG